MYLPERPSMQRKTDLLQGTLDLLILKTLELDAMHGWGISKRIRHLSKDVLDVNQGSLYPALYRLEGRGWIASSWGTSEEGRRIKVYRLTPKGRRQLAAEKAEWALLSTAVDQVLDA
jgi:transcriptional regulator